MKKKPEGIKGIVDRVIKTLNRKRLKDGGVFLFWEEVVGKKIAKHTKPLQIKEERLVVGVDSSVWLYHLNFFKKKILDGLKKKGGANIKKLSFKVGKF